MSSKVVKKKPESRLDKVSLPYYSQGEEIANSVSHGIGAALAIAALVLCAVKETSVHAKVGGVLYCVIMIILFTVSAVYHALSRYNAATGKKVLRIIDHINVMMMVAGTYLPICLGLLYGQNGWILFSIVWGVTVPAIILNAIDVDKYQVVSTIHSVLLGWGATFLFRLIKETAGQTALNFLIAGGVAYSLGCVLYAFGYKKKWFHSIFHVFVVIGAALHFFFVFFYCL